MVVLYHYIDYTLLNTNISCDVVWLQHAIDNVEPNKMVKTWTFMWTTPDTIKSESIIFNFAANAANGDASEFGDWIYVSEIVVKTER